jgi:hypothetical protein
MIRIDNQQAAALRTQPAGQPTGKPERVASPSVGEDRYTPSRPGAHQPVTYGGKIAGGQAQPPAFDPLRDYVVSLLREQGLATDTLAASPEEAAAAIADDGYWGVEQTAERIYQFAIGAAGADPSRLEQIRAAVMQGYEEAKELFGGSLPEISQRTIERVSEKFDAWERQHSEGAAPTDA